VALAVGGVGRRSTGGGGGRALGTTAEVRGEPTAAGEAGKWGHDGTSFGTSGEHYRTEVPKPSSSLSPCGGGSHRPR
jgi:hypothetical protein